MLKLDVGIIIIIIIITRRYAKNLSLICHTVSLKADLVGAKVIIHCDIQHPPHSRC